MRKAWAWLYRRATAYASRHALAFMLWGWRRSEADRSRLKQRVRELEAQLADGH